MRRAVVLGASEGDGCGRDQRWSRPFHLSIHLDLIIAVPEPKPEAVAPIVIRVEGRALYVHLRQQEEIVVVHRLNMLAHLHTFKSDDNST